MKQKHLVPAAMAALLLLSALPGSAAAGGTAYARTQSIRLNGSPVELHSYALLDENGFETNYVRLRDVASLLSDTPARFSVGWDGAVTLTTGAAYTPDGSEFTLPFSGDRSYTVPASATRVDGADAALTAILLTDDAGGGYTYYQLRALGEAVGCTVSWSAETGICLDTGTGGDWRDNVLMADPPQGDSMDEKAGTPVLGGDLPRDRIGSITVLDTLRDCPDDAWDVSRDGDGSVMAWAEADGSLYDLYLAGDGGIAAPTDCSGLFYGYENVRAIRFNGNFHTDNTTSMNAMFSYCEDLETVDVDGFDTAAVTDMNRMFNYCQDLETLDVSGFDTAAVTDMGAMFNYCEALEAVDVSDFDTARVTDLSGMFSGCRSLTQLDVTGFDTGSATVMGYMFCECEGLKSLDVRGWDLSKVTATSGMFSYCPRLTDLQASGWDLSHVTYTLHMFDGSNTNAAKSGIRGLDGGGSTPSGGGSTPSGGGSTPSGGGSTPSGGGSSGGSSSGSRSEIPESSHSCSFCLNSGVLECEECDGTGWVTCSYCDGAGGEYELDLGTPLYDGVGSGDKGYIWEDCSRCHGRGEEQCDACWGRGEVECWHCQ